jgi:hypothetical protein
LIQILFPAGATALCRLAPIVLLLIVTGCGDGRYTVVPAKGKVVCNGKPVTMGSVSFNPIGEAGDAEPGKPASAALSADGTFRLTTNESFDGAIVGKHNVRYFAPEGEDEEDTTSVEEGSAAERERNAARAKRLKAQAQSLCVQRGEIVVEVKADGENDFTIELSPASTGGYVEGSSGD